MFDGVRYEASSAVVLWGSSKKLFFWLSGDPKLFVALERFGMLLCAVLAVAKFYRFETFIKVEFPLCISTQFAEYHNSLKLL